MLKYLADAWLRAYKAFDEIFFGCTTSQMKTCVSTKTVMHLLQAKTPSVAHH